MELIYNPAKKNDFQSFYSERRKTPYYGGDWHYHEEYELIYTIKGDGVRIVGDSMDYFDDPELILMGKNLPHVFRNDHAKNENVDYIVIKFGNLFDGNSIFDLPEMNKIKQMLQHSNRGINFSQSTIQKISKTLINLEKSTGAAKILNLLQALNMLSTEDEYEFLSSENFVLNDSDKKDRIHNVINYISDNYAKDITLEDLAEVSYMTTNSFCRYFKNKTGKTAFEFLREFRVAKASQMLINGQKSISEICYDTGFNSFSSFNRIFKSVKKVSAGAYRNTYATVLAN